MPRRRSGVVSVATAALAVSLLAAASPAQADSTNASVGFGQLYYDGAVVRTVATPTSQPGAGVDAIYAFPGDKADGQLSITSVAPGDRDYHGGRWAVYVVEWNVTPYTITSDAALLAAAGGGELSIARMPAADFVCPVTPAPNA
jgi:hypothetical protein